MSFNIDDLIKEVAGNDSNTGSTPSVTVADTTGSEAKSKSGLFA